MPPLLALLLAAAGPALSAGASSPEMRGLWVVRTALVSPEAVDGVVDQACEAGFNTLFVQVRGRGDAFYDSRLAPRSAIIHGEPGGFDPLRRLLERARGRGLAIHAWVNVLLSAHFGQPLPEGHIVARHPEWLMVPRSAAREALLAKPSSLLALIRQAGREEGDAEGYYLSPSAPGVPARLEEVVRELLRGYPVQGLHLDFVRYPGPEYDYSRAALEGFARRRVGADLLGGPAAESEAWSVYRRDVLTALAERLCRVARAERPGLIVSAAVVADEAAAVHHKFQDWPSWLAHGLLDAVCPMAYTPDSRLFREQIEQARLRLGLGQALWAGVGAYRLRLPAILEQVRLARESGASGVVIFSHESLSPGDWKRLGVEAFPATLASGAQGGGLAPARAQPR